MSTGKKEARMLTELETPNDVLVFGMWSWSEGRKKMACNHVDIDFRIVFIMMVITAKQMFSERGELNGKTTEIENE